MKDKKVIGSNQCGFTNRKSCVTNVMAFQNDMISLMDEGKALDIAYLDFSKAFDIVSYNILIDQLTKQELDKWTVRQTENRLNDCDQWGCYQWHKVASHQWCVSEVNTGTNTA